MATTALAPNPTDLNPAGLSDEEWLRILKRAQQSGPTAPPGTPDAFANRLNDRGGVTTEPLPQAAATSPVSAPTYPAAQWPRDVFQTQNPPPADPTPPPNPQFPAPAFGWQAGSGERPASTPSDRTSRAVDLPVSFPIEPPPEMPEDIPLTDSGPAPEPKYISSSFLDPDDPGYHPPGYKPPGIDLLGRGDVVENPKLVRDRALEQGQHVGFTLSSDGTGRVIPSDPVSLAADAIRIRQQHIVKRAQGKLDRIGGGVQVYLADDSGDGFLHVAVPNHSWFSESDTGSDGLPEDLTTAHREVLDATTAKLQALNQKLKRLGQYAPTDLEKEAWRGSGPGGVAYSAGAKALSGLSHAVAGVGDFFRDLTSFPGQKAFDPNNQPEFDRIYTRMRELDAQRQQILKNWDQPQSIQELREKGPPYSQLHQLGIEYQNLAQRATGLSNPPREQSLPGKISRFAADAQREAEKVPGWEGSVGRATGTVLPLIPTMAMGGLPGLALGAAQAAAEAESATRTAKTDELRDQENLDPQSVDRAAASAAYADAFKSALATPIYLGAGRLTGGLVGAAMKGAGRLPTVLAQTAGATAANVSTGALLRALEGEAPMPNLEQVGVDALWGIIHGRQVNASESAKAHAADLLRSRGWSKQDIASREFPARFRTGEIQPPTTAFTLPDAIARSLPKPKPIEALADALLSAGHSVADIARASGLSETGVRNAAAIASQIRARQVALTPTATPPDSRPQPSPVVPPMLDARNPALFPSPPADTPPRFTLAPFEQEVHDRVSAGQSIEQIAQAMGRSTEGVRNAFEIAKQKLARASAIRGPDSIEPANSGVSLAKTPGPGSREPLPPSPPPSSTAVPSGKSEDAFASRKSKVSHPSEPNALTMGLDENGVHTLAKPTPSRYESEHAQRTDPAAILESFLREGRGPNAEKRWKYGRQIASHSEVLDWATAAARIFQNHEEIGEKAASGGEHSVYYQPSSGRVFKITKPGLYGAQAEDAGAYLQRWALQNRIFRDAVQVEGYVTLPGEHTARIVISQPFVEGRDANPLEISDFLRGKGFVEIEPTKWVHPITGIKVWDGITPGNVIIRPDGSAMPIDLQLEPANANELRQAQQQTGLGLPPVYFPPLHR